MRILNLSAQKPHSTGSGVYLTETVRQFAAVGHDCAVVAGLCREDAASFPEGVEFFPVYYDSPALPFPVCGMSDEMPYESTVYRSMSDEMVSRFESEFGRVVRLAVDKFHPDLIICHHLYLLCALTRRLVPDIPVYGLCHGTDLRQLRTNSLRREEIIAAAAGIDRACCLHEQQRREVMELFGLPPERAAVVGVGYNDQIFHDRGIRTPHRELRLMYAGKISEKKGVYSLISALDRLGLRREDFSLRLAGGWNGQEQRERAERMIAESGWDAELLGPLSQEALAMEYSFADVFVLPSFFEGLPLVLSEAMACGAKAVCTDLPGIRQWMDAMLPDNGIFFVPPPMINADTPMASALSAFEAALASSIRDAAASPALTRDLSALSWAAVAKRILS